MPVGGICCGQVYLGGDGRLWLWDIFGAPKAYPNLTAGTHYEHPMEPKSPLDLNFELMWNGKQLPLSVEGYKEVQFEGRYPMAQVIYQEDSVQVELQVVSPFIPLNEDNSNLPCILLRYKIRNEDNEPGHGSIDARMSNPVGAFSGHKDSFDQKTEEIKIGSWAGNLYHAQPKPVIAPDLPDVELSHWQDGTYGGWVAEGTAFGPAPVNVDKLPERLSPANPKRKFFVNTHEARHGEDSPTADRHLGTLTSPSFEINRNYLNFRIGGGNHPNETCMNLIAEGKVVRTDTGGDSSVLRAVTWDVREFVGKQATLQIVDKHTGGWGHISIDSPVLSDAPAPPDIALDHLPDFGSMALVSRKGGDLQLKPGHFTTVDFLIAWHFPNYGEAHHELYAMKGFENFKRHYAKRFKDASEVAEYFIKNEKRLVGDATLWVDTWYDSTLPYWFLERTLLPTGCLQTQTAHRFDNGRFYGWEGIYCCAGTCQHVWNYAQAVGRLFPELERDTRERVDYGIAFQPDGTLWYRAESHQQIAHDGQAGTILRTWREHTTSLDEQFLRRNWPKIKKSIERLIADDKGRDGILDGWQYNTLDAAWYGEISWISSLYLAALQAGKAMATDMGDESFKAELNEIIQKGRKNIPDRLFNGEYFIQKRDPAHLEAPGSGIGCHIDQVFGESYLHQVGLEPLLDRHKVRTALKSLWKYNFVPDAGAYRKKISKYIPGGRWYAMDREAGLLMTTFPKGGVEDAPGKGNPNWMVGYFNECMNGFEYQVAAHMIAEGMVDEGLAIVKSLEDRYHESKRNPYNEIECSDHYSRSMAAYGCFLTACGFAYHGPKGILRFAPKISPENFKAAFTTAKGWGSFSHRIVKNQIEVDLELKWGKLKLNELQIELPVPRTISTLQAAKLNGKSIGVTYTANHEIMRFKKPVQMKTGDVLRATFHLTA
jgi:non-lysosomal glucosylceramidase